MTGRLQRLFGFYVNAVFAKFLLAGGLAALANFASRLLFQPFTGFDVAVVMAYLVGFTTAFLLNRAYVFPKSGKPMRVEMAWFFLFNLIAFPVVVVSAVLLRDHLFVRFLSADLAETMAHGVAILIPVIFNFAAHRLITFGARSEGKEDA